MTTACANSTAPSVAVKPSADLLQPCPALPALSDGKARTVLLWSVQAAYLYRDCAARHGALVDVLQ